MRHGSPWRSWCSPSWCPARRPYSWVIRSAVSRAPLQPVFALQVSPLSAHTRGGRCAAAAGARGTLAPSLLGLADQRVLLAAPRPQDARTCRCRGGDARPVMPLSSMGAYRCTVMAAGRHANKAFRSWALSSRLRAGEPCRFSWAVRRTILSLGAAGWAAVAALAPPVAAITTHCGRLLRESRHRRGACVTRPCRSSAR